MDSLPADATSLYVPLSEMMDPQVRPFRLGASMFTPSARSHCCSPRSEFTECWHFLVRQRTSEIGIRMALGALPQNVLKLVIWQGMKFAALGLIIGIAAALSLTRLVRTLLFEVHPTDAASYITACAAVLITVALLACLLPAWRAAGVSIRRRLCVTNSRCRHRINMNRAIAAGVYTEELHV